MIVFYPRCGLANRMRVIDSAINLCSQFEKPYRIYWLKDSELNCNFSSIWKPISGLRDTNIPLLPLFFKLRRRSKIFRFLLSCLDMWHILKVFNEMEYEEWLQLIQMPKKFQAYRHIFVSSFSAFYPSSVFRTNLFCLQPTLFSKVEDETMVFDDNTIGIHIRRTDNILSIKQSPLSLFEERMNKDLNTNPNMKFYVASDASDIKHYLKDCFKDKVILSNGILERNTEAGTLQAVVELYALSRTSKILGSYYSSFSVIASHLGSISMETIQVEN